MFRIPLKYLAFGMLASAVVLPRALRAREAVALQPVTIPEPSNQVLESTLPDFSEESYRAAVEALIGTFERRMGTRLGPSTHRRAGLKVYSDSGAGLGTPPAMVGAVIESLVRRGFKREDLMIVGLNKARLRSAGFVPPLSEGGSAFESVPVIALDSGAYYDPGWFYDSPLPARISSGLIGIDEESDLMASEADRKSFLPTPLMFEVDFWINLPSCSDHPVLGVNGALVNATLWNASNTQRFFRSPASGPAAVAEIAAVPELRAGMVFTMVSLQRYQFIGGPVFNSLYTLSEPRVWLSDNPVMIDALLRQRIDRGRYAVGFRVLPEQVRLIGYAQQLGLGVGDLKRLEWVHVPASGE